MNEWIKKSIELANGRGYLDKLNKVYPVTFSVKRPLEQNIKNRLKVLFDRKAKLGLLKMLINLEKFPIKDPYVAFFKRNPKALETNPKTVRRIANILMNIPY